MYRTWMYPVRNGSPWIAGHIVLCAGCADYSHRPESDRVRESFADCESKVHEKYGDHD